MYLIAIAWIYVVLMMAVAEALSPQGSVLGAIFTFLLYGLLPLSIVMFIVGTPARRRALRAAEAAEAAALAEAEAAAVQAAAQNATPTAAPTAAVSAAASAAPDGSRHAAADAVAPERKET